VALRSTVSSGIALFSMPSYLHVSSSHYQARTTFYSACQDASLNQAKRNQTMPGSTQCLNSHAT
jgi:hypothetical protein